MGKRHPLMVGVTEERVKEIFSVPKTKELWEELRDSPKFQKVVRQTISFEEATMITIVTQATQLVIDEGTPFDEAVQQKIQFHKNKL